MNENELRARVDELERIINELTFWEPDSENFQRVRNDARILLNSADRAAHNT